MPIQPRIIHQVKQVTIRVVSDISPAFALIKSWKAASNKVLIEYVNPVKITPAMEAEFKRFNPGLPYVVESTTPIADPKGTCLGSGFSTPDAVVLPEAKPAPVPAKKAKKGANAS